jgi:hypothetical protein
VYQPKRNIDFETVIRAGQPKKPDG